MSLVGSLEDLGLGDILQIISLSGKSGVLQLRADEGNGRILFDQGRIRIAFLGADEPTLETLRPDGVVPEGEERDECLRQLIEHTVFQMFTWTTGEFSFEVGDVTEVGNEALLLDPGVNPQFLALEGTRMADESAAGMGFGSEGLPAGAVVVADPADEQPASFEPPDLGVTPVPTFSGESDATAEFLSEGESAAPAEFLSESEGFGEGSFAKVMPEPEAPSLDEAPAPAIPVVEPEPLPLAEVEAETPASIPLVADAAEPMAAEAIAEAATAATHEPPPAPVAAAPQQTPPVAASAPTPAIKGGEVPPLVFVDPDLSVVEWARSSLPEGLPAAHLFQSPDQGIQRIRQYLRRAEAPLVVLGTQLPPDSLSGARSPEELVARLQKQAPHMKVLLLEETGRPLPPALEKLGAHAGRLCKPNPTQLADPRLADARTRLGEEFAAGLLGACGIQVPQPESGPAVEELRQVSSRLRDASTTGDILPQVLAFATRVFPRVGLFVVRDEEVQGLAQVGLPTAGGPDDLAFQQIGLHTTSSGWLRKVLATRAPVRTRLDGAPSDPGDAQLIDLLGQQVPQEFWLAPIVSSDRVVALLYADRLPEATTLGDTAALEVVLHHAGLALDRTALERALDGSGS